MKNIAAVTAFAVLCPGSLLAPSAMAQGAAAQRLGFIRAGTAEVKLEVVGKLEPRRGK